MIRGSVIQMESRAFHDEWRILKQVPKGSLVVPFGFLLEGSSDSLSPFRGWYLGSYKMIPKSNYSRAYGYSYVYKPGLGQAQFRAL